MAATPVNSPFASPPGFVERRQLPDRRTRDRRIGALVPIDDRRRNPERRHPVGRRETSVGHLRNALQTLALLRLGNIHEQEHEALRAAAERLWYALYEIQRPLARPSDPFGTKPMMGDGQP